MEFIAQKLKYMTQRNWSTKFLLINSLKCERGIDSEVVKFAMLTEDYTKIAFACVDRSIIFHAQYGYHYKTRIPKCPRNIVFNPFIGDLIISASSD